ncbi:MAG: cytochrome P450 [Nocardioides sp.]|nr:cytochrome P450 [Nocardioides sp.]
MSTPSATPALDVFAPGALEDPFALFARLRAEDPIHRVPGTRVHLVSRWDDVHGAVLRPDDFSSNLRVVLARGPDGTVREQVMDGNGTVEQVLATADDPAHKLHRGLLMATLGKRVRSLSAYVDAQVDECWAEIADRAHAGEVIDWVPAMADALPIAVIAHLIGLPHDDLDRLVGWVFDSTEMLGGLVEADRMPHLYASVVDLWAYLEQHLAGALESPGDDLLGVLAQAHQRGEIGASTAVLILIQLVGAGGESTASLLGSMARVLAERPDLHQRLRAEPDLVDAFTDEVLRLESPFRGHYRTVLRDTDLGGRSLNAGDHLLLLWASANRDETHFERPDDVDLDRPRLRQHLAFGKGMHFCAGSALARLEATAVIRRLVTATTEISIAAPDQPVWVPSIFVRRHARLPLRLTLA